MIRKLQSTGIRKNVGEIFSRLESWASNPWRKYSLFLIIFLSSFSLGGSLGMINGALALMDPVGAFLTVLFIEILIKFRRTMIRKSNYSFIVSLVDASRLGLIYGLFNEAFKLL